MSKATFLVVFLLGICAIIISKTAGRGSASELATGTPFDQSSLRPAREPDDIVIVNSRAKSDKLAVVTPVETAKGVTVDLVKTAPTNKKGLEPVPAETRSWHWSARSNKITRK